MVAWCLIPVVVVLGCALTWGLCKRVEQAEPPACFRGVPLALITAGLLGLALAGFWGVFR